jgi:hypothetical protein
MPMDLETRVRRLEWWNRLLLISVISLLAYGFTSQYSVAKAKVEKVLRAERLEIMGQQGEPAAVLGFDDAGSAGLFINDPGGSVRVALAHDSDGSALFIRDAKGVIRVGVAQFSHGGGGVALHGPDSKGAAVLYFKETGSLTFFDTEGNPTSRVPEASAE